MPSVLNITWLRRNCRRYLLLLTFVVVITTFVILELLDQSTSRQMIILNKSGPIEKVTTSHIGATTNPAIHRKTDVYKHLTDSFVRNITPKANLKSLINATKTKYPLTINAPYLMHDISLCSSVRNLSVIVIVHSAPSHFDRRNAMRDTWTNDSLYKHLGTVRVLFLLGRVNDPSMQNLLEDEFKKYRDLLQGDFIDAYRNLTHKGVMGYKWISEHCRNARIVLKVDDDVVVDMFRFFTDYYPKYSTQSKKILCNHIYPGTMLIIREKKSKWYVDEDHFKGQKYYPRYCSGFMVMITNDVIPAIFRSASLTPFFWVDDVYLYGLAPGNVPGIRYAGLKKSDHQLNGQTALKCYRNESRTCDFFVAGASTRAVMVEIWSNMANLYKERMNTSKQVLKQRSTTQNVGSTEGELWNHSSTVHRPSKGMNVIGKSMEDKELDIRKIVTKLKLL